ncbi:hypothetical protein HAX54_012924, partial [Datura stramonium]|nr:hypothetical protein [Datura stramonium]
TNENQGWTQVKEKLGIKPITTRGKKELSLNSTNVFNILADEGISKDDKQIPSSNGKG